MPVYPHWVEQAVGRVSRLLHWGESLPAVGVLRRYDGLIASEPNPEVARTFYNSVIRRVLGTVGVDHTTEFLDPSPPAPITEDGLGLTLKVPDSNALRGVLCQLLDLPRFAARWCDREACIGLAAERLCREVQEVERGSAIQVIPAVFFRGKGAFLVGRLHTENRAMPLLLALLHPPDGLLLDAVLLTADEASIVFGFSRSYFQVELERVRPAVGFLRSLMPGKRMDELYTALGYHKHGKREFYQELLHHLSRPDARFEVAEGDRGMVMNVFTLPPLNTVFKVIKDRFDHPKRLTHREVRAKYQLVFGLDHAGRLADAQEFEGLELFRDRFSPPLLEELLNHAGETVRLDGEQVVIRHTYTERRVTPLNLYLRAADPAAARAAVIDFGYAIKDLASVNIFPGDMLTKNFGVTRHGRVVFYDYDEICLLTDCTFRRLPPARDDADEWASEPWFHVAERDVFPEEFWTFMAFPGALGAAFRERHADLLAPEYWQEMQARAARGDLEAPRPYPEERRLR